MSYEYKVKGEKFYFILSYDFKHKEVIEIGDGSNQKYIVSYPWWRRMLGLTRILKEVNNYE